MYRSVIVFSVIWAQIAGQCRFPTTWQGKWFQSGLGEMTIRDDSISLKGRCREHHRDYYLVENRESSCFQCLLIMQRHANIIQYKETYCVAGESLQDICSQIRVEAILYTLIREPSRPVPCPFLNGYHFSYNNNSGGFCRQPSSYAKACASPSRFRFEFEHCSDAAYTYKQDMDFDCLATWKDGSDMYMYGEFAGPKITDKNAIYRCFMFKLLGTVVYLAMSADATCRGLRSSQDGPLVMEFTQDIFGWPTPMCEYPSWFRRDTWQDLADEHEYKVDSPGSTLTYYARRHTTAPPKARQAYRCVVIQRQNTSDTQFIAITHASHDCESNFQCVRIVRRQPNIVEIYRGGFVQAETDTCTERHFRHTEPHLLIPRSLVGKPCPFTGRYFIRPDSTGCQVNVRSGCNNNSKLEIVSSCVARPVGQLQCLESWSEGGRQYMIARTLTHPRRTVANCFSFFKNGDTIEFSTDRKCNKGAPDIFDNEIRYTMNANPGTCDEEPQVLPAAEKPQSHSPDASYKHTNEETKHKNDLPSFYSNGVNGANINSVPCHTIVTWILSLLTAHGLLIFFIR